MHADAQQKSPPQLTRCMKLQARPILALSIIVLAAAVLRRIRQFQILHYWESYEAASVQMSYSGERIWWESC